MPLQTSLSSDNFKKFKPLLCPSVAELQRLSRNVILCLPLSRLPSTFPVKDKNSKPLRLHTCPKNSICLLIIVFNSDLWTFPSFNTFTLGFFSVHEILNIRLIDRKKLLLAAAYHDLSPSQTLYLSTSLYVISALIHLTRLYALLPSRFLDTCTECLIHDIWSALEIYREAKFTI